MKSKKSGDKKRTNCFAFQSFYLLWISIREKLRNWNLSNVIYVDSETNQQNLST